MLRSSDETDQPDLGLPRAVASGDPTSLRPPVVSRSLWVLGRPVRHHAAPRENLPFVPDFPASPQVARRVADVRGDLAARGGSLLAAPFTPAPPRPRSSGSRRASPGRRGGGP